MTLLPLLVLLLSAAPDPTPRRTPVLVELFTSEGCSSCPPADALLLRLSREQPVPGAHVVALSEHVDYWDDLGWRDPHSDPAHSLRQASYVRNLRRDAPYTPQIVVDGERDLVGSREGAIREAIAAAAARPKGSILVAPASQAGSVRVEASWRGQEEADVFLAVVRRLATTRVSRGENAGRTLQHASVVLSLDRVGTGDGRWEDVVRPRRTLEADDQLVAFVQAKGGGRILAVAEWTSPRSP